MPAPGRWMPASKLRTLFQAGLTYDEIADVNERSEGWKPTRSAVARKYQRMGMPPRYASHHELLPWKIRPEHNHDRFRYMLQAEGRRRRGEPMSETDEYLVSLLHNLLYDRGMPLVVGYNEHVGFYLSSQLPTDTDIIREHEPDVATTESQSGGMTPKFTPPAI